MKLDPETWRALSALLDRALDLDEFAREAWLAGLGNEQAALTPLLRSMLAREQHVETRDFLDGLPPFDIDEDGCPNVFVAGALVGPYRLVRELGRGGMGEVWLAERADGLIRRPVALKLPLVALSRTALAERFAREREILSSLAHPGIARLYDAGFAADGQPYLALEYVDGIPLTRYADERRLSIDARIALFDQVIDAVAHAHASLVLHRDLKPSNILVTPGGEVKLLDFGIAKLMQSDGFASETALTRVAGHALTLDYAAPEQIAGAPLTTGVDVYALGVVLYELLVGARPYRLKHGTRGELEEAIARVEPVAPSRAFLSESVAAARAANRRRLRRRLSGDLDTIALKALKKTPGERFASAQALGEDLGRMRKGEPVLARPDSVAYRARKFALRHRVGLSATMLLVVVLAASTAVSLMQASIARREALRAETSKAFVAQVFESVARNNPGGAAAANTTARQLLDLGTRQVLDRPRADPALQLDLLQLLARLNLELDLIAPANELAERSVALARSAYGIRSVEFAHALMQRADTRYRVASYADAIVDLRQVLQIAARHPQNSAELRAKAHMLIGNSLYQLDMHRGADARRELEEALELLKRIGATSEDRSRVAYFLAWTYEPERNFTQAQAYFDDGIAAGRRNFGERSFIVAYGYEGLANMLLQQGRLAEAREAIAKAISIYEFVLGPRHGTVAFATTNLALIEAASGQRAEAEQTADRAVALAREVFGARARQLGFPLVYAARIKANRGELEAAARSYEEALDVFGHGESLESHTNRLLRIEYAQVLMPLGQAARASALLDESTEAFASTNDADSPRGAWLMMAKAELAYAQGDAKRGDERFKEALERLEALDAQADSMLPRFAAAVARTHPTRERANAMLADLQRRKLAPPSAEELAIDIEDKARLEFALGRLYLALDRPGDALAWLASAKQLRERVDAPESAWLAETEVALAEALHRADRDPEARVMLDQADAISAATPALTPALGEPLRTAHAMLGPR
ncbi:MAG TPA: tetratricopeptide repeat protein [Casimicrobiaceae bacterium]